MATFRVGQRVRITGARFSWTASHIGRTGTVVGLPGDNAEGEYRVNIDGATPLFRTWWYTLPEHLASLTDPRADEFIADMERFAKIAVSKPVTA